MGLFNAVSQVAVLPATLATVKVNELSENVTQTFRLEAIAAFCRRSEYLGGGEARRRRVWPPPTG
jgi:hypothetical protein